MNGECPICGKYYKGRNKYCCSMTCYAVYKTNKSKCIICGKQFNKPQCSLKITCSKECSKINRQSQKLIDNNLKSLKKAHEIAKTHPKTGHFETNSNARSWKIQSPNGQIFECRNLKLWLENHEEMLDGTILQAWDGITKIKYSMQGKRKNKSYQWKGWILLEWSD